MQKIKLSIILSLVILQISAQQNPAKIKWKQIETEHTTVIFPREIEQEGQRTANLINYLYQYETKTLNTKPKKLPVLLFNQSTVSNGFASLLPRRSVWYSTPSQDVTTLSHNDWFVSLATHEYRHIVQFSKMNSGFTKFLGVFYGNIGQIIGQYSVPYWFFEGDAICSETAFSGSGRGRIPKFEMQIKTLLMNDINYSYNKAKLGSHKKY